MDEQLKNAALRHYAEIARLGQALGSPVRLRLLDLLRQAPRSVDALSAQAGLPVANVSQHLRQLKAANLLVSEREGQRVIYHLADPVVSEFFIQLRTFSERLLPELDRIKHLMTSTAASLPVEELWRLRADGLAVVVDVRPRDEYDHAHVDGSLSIPLQELPQRLEELPRDKIIVTTCRGPYCPMAIAAVEILKEAGFRAVHVDLDGHVTQRAGAEAAEPSLAAAPRNE